MELLKKENTVVWIILYIITFGLSNVFLAHLLKLLKNDAWYLKAFYVIPLMFLTFATAIINPLMPFLMLGFIFNYYITIKVSDKLDIPGSEYYNCPYFIIGFGLIPIIGWSIIFSLYIFLNLYIFIKISAGACEQFIED